MNIEPDVMFHEYTIVKVLNTKTNKYGWRIVGLWGDYEKGEGNRLGPTFAEDEYDNCLALVYQLEKELKLPVSSQAIIKYFKPMKILKRLNGVGEVFDTDNIETAVPSNEKPGTDQALSNFHRSTDHTFLRRFFPSDHRIFEAFENAYYYNITTEITAGHR